MPIRERVIVNIRHKAMTLLNWFVFLSLVFFFSRRKVYVQLSQGGKIVRTSSSVQICDADTLLGVTTERREKKSTFVLPNSLYLLKYHTFTQNVQHLESLRCILLSFQPETCNI